MTRTELGAGEFNPYYGQYIDQVSANLELVDALKQSKTTTLQFFKTLPKDKATYRYQEGKWTPKEVIQHLVDTERVFSYRALRFTRNDKSELMGFEQDDFVLNSGANDRSLKDLLKEYKTVRNATIALYKSASVKTLSQVGVASGSPLSARAAGFITAGHDLHHIQLIKERYL